MIYRTRISAFAITLTILAAIALLPIATQHAWATEAKSSASGALTDVVLTGGGQSQGTLQAQGALRALADTRTYETPDGLAVVQGVESGKFSYNEATCTLTLSNVKAEAVVFKKSGTLTLNLKGKNKAAMCDEASVVGASANANATGDDNTNASGNDPAKGSLIIKGKGSLDGTISIGGNLSVEGGATTATTGEDDDNHSRYSISCNDLTMRGGALTTTQGEWGESGIYCNRLTVHAGSINATCPDGYEGCLGYGIRCKSLVMRGGSIVATSDIPCCDSYGIACEGKLVMRGGKLVAKALGGGDIGFDAFGISCGSLVMRNGTLKAESTVMDSGEFGVLDNKGYGILCSSFSMSGGSLSATCKGKCEYVDNGTAGYGINCSMFSLSGGTLRATSEDEYLDEAIGVSCSGAFKVSGGKAIVNAKGSERGDGVSCASLAMKGGILKVRSYSDAARVGGKAKVTGGKLTARTARPAKAYAVRAASLSYKAGCIASVRGGMARGFAFKYRGNAYRSLGGDKVKLVKLAKGGTAFRTVAYAGHKYTVK